MSGDDFKGPDRRKLDPWQKNIEHDLKNLRMVLAGNTETTKKIQGGLEQVEERLADAADSVSALKKSISENTKMTADIATFLGNLAVLNKLAKWTGRVIAFIGPIAALVVAARSIWK